MGCCHRLSQLETPRHTSCGAARSPDMTRGTCQGMTMTRGRCRVHGTCSDGAPKRAYGVNGTMQAHSTLMLSFLYLFVRLWFGRGPAASQSLLGKSGRLERKAMNLQLCALASHGRSWCGVVHAAAGSNHHQPLTLATANYNSQLLSSLPPSGPVTCGNNAACLATAERILRLCCGLHCWPRAALGQANGHPAQGVTSNCCTKGTAGAAGACGGNRPRAASGTVCLSGVYCVRMPHRAAATATRCVFAHRKPVKEYREATFELR